MKKKLLLATACLAVILGVLYLVIRKDTQQQIDDFIRSATQYEQKEEWDTAIICLRNVLQLAPMRGDVHARLAYDYARVSKYVDCLQHYEAAMRYGVKSEDFLRNYAAFCEKAGASDYLGKPAKELLNLAPRDPQAQYWMACSLQEKDPLMAISYAEDSLSAEPSVKTYLLLAQLHASRQDFDKASSVLKEGIEKFPAEAQLFSGLASIEVHQNKTEDANQHALQALDLAESAEKPDKIAVYSVASVVLKLLGDTDRSIELYRRLIELDPENVQFKISLARLYLDTQEHADEALALLKAAVEQNPDIDVLQLAYVETLVHLQKTDEAEKALADLPVDIKQSASVAYLNGLLLMQKGRFLEAEPLLRKAAETLTDRGAAGLALGLCYQNLNLLESAEKQFDLVVRVSPDNPDALFGLAEINLNRGNVDSAEGYAQQLLAAGAREDEARQILKQCKLIRGIDSGEAVKLATAENASEDEQVGLAQALLSNKKFQEAEEIIDKVLAEHPENDTAVLVKSSIMHLSGRTNESTQYLAQQAEERGDDEKIVIGYANLLLQSDEPVKAVEVLHGLVQRLPKSAVTHSSLARGLFASGKKEEALASFLVAAELEPDVLEYRTDLVTCYAEAGKFEQAHQELQRAKKDLGEQLSLMAIEGSLLLREDRQEEAVACFQSMTNRWPDQPEGHLLVGMAMQKKGDTPAAITAFEAARRVAPTDVRVLSQLRDVYLQAGLYAKALEQSQSLMRMRRNSPKNRHSLALSLAGTGQSGKALEILEELAAENPSSAGNYLQMAALRANTGEHKGALEAVDKALDVDRSPSVVQAACSIYWQLKEFDKARALIESETEDNEKLYHSMLAQHYINAGDVAKAEEHLQKVADLNENNPWAYCRLGDFYYAHGPRHSKARACYNKALELSPEMAYAKRQLASLEANSGNLKGAEDILQKTLQAVPNDQSARAGLIEIAIERMKLVRSEENEQAALQQANDFIKQNSRSARAHYLMAVVQLLCRQPDPTGAQRNIDQALELDPTDVDARLLKAKLALKNGLTDTARSDCERVLQYQPQNIESALLLGAILQNRDASESDYEQVLKKYPNNAAVKLISGTALSDAKPQFAQPLIDAALQQRDWRLAEYYAGQLLKAGDFDKAVEAVTPFAKDGKTEAKRLLADARQMSGQIPQAMALQKEIYGETKTFLDLQRLIVIMLSGRKIDEAVGVLQNEIARHPQNTDARLLLAKVYGQAGQLQESVGEAEKVLLHEPQNEQARLTIATASMMLKDYKKAAEEYEKVLNLNPYNRQAANNLSYIYAEHLERAEEAQRIILPVAQQNPDLPEVQDTHGLVLLKLNRFDEAKEAFEKAARLQPEDPTIVYHLGVVYAKLQDAAQAKKYLQKVLDLDPKFEKAAEARRLLEKIE